MKEKITIKTIDGKEEEIEFISSERMRKAVQLSDYEAALLNTFKPVKTDSLKNCELFIDKESGDFYASFLIAGSFTDLVKITDHHFKIISEKGFAKNHCEGERRVDEQSIKIHEYKKEISSLSDSVKKLKGWIAIHSSISVIMFLVAYLTILSNL